MRNKLVLLTPWMALGGADRCGLDVVEAFRSIGWETAVVATRHDDRQHSKRDAFEVAAHQVICDDRFETHLVDIRPDIVLINHSHEAYERITSIKRILPKCKLVCLHHMLLPAPWDFERTFNERDIDLVITVSHRLKAELEALDVRSMIRPLHWFGFRPTEELLEKKPEYILCPMRLHQQKRPEFLIPIVQALRKRERTPPFWIVGAGVLEASLKKKVRIAGLEKQILFKGERDFDQMRELFAGAIALCCPSVDEGIPLSYFEAQECGVPLAVSDVGAVHEIVPAAQLVELKCEGEAGCYAELLESAISAAPARPAYLANYERWKFRLFEMLLDL